MKKFVLISFTLLVVAGLTGCPVLSGGVSTGKLTGTWQWVEASRLVDPTTVDDHDSEAVAQNFANEGRVRKTLVFGEEKEFTYVEETFLPDRQAQLRADKGVGVGWSWVETYRATGTYTTSGFNAANNVLAIPGLDTELNTTITQYTDTYQILKRDTDGNLVPDSQLRTLFEYVTSSSSATTENPLVLRGLLGLNPFDELMVSWAQFFVGKDLNYNYSFSNTVETYLRVIVEEENE